MSKTGSERDSLTGFLRDHEKRLRRLEHRRLVTGGSSGGGGVGDCTDCDDRFVNEDGDTMTGPLVLPGMPAGPNEAASKAYVDLMDEVIISLADPGTANTYELWYDPDASLPASAGQGFVFNQGVAANVWTIDHPLDFIPNVTVVDSGGSQIEGDVAYVDADTIRVTFSAAFAGTAYLS